MFSRKRSEDASSDVRFGRRESPLRFCLSLKSKWLACIFFLFIVVATMQYLRAPNAVRSVGKTEHSELRPPPPLGCSPMQFIPTKTEHDLCIITRVKNSAEWIPEWIEYHRLLGADRFFIADDCSTDNGATIAILDYYASLGFVEYYQNVSAHPCNLPDRQPHEELLISYVFNQSKDAKCDWVAMIDIDEYITLLDGIESTLGLKGLLKAWVLPWIKLGWWTVGSDGHETKPDLLTIEAYRRGIFETYHQKTVARTGAVIEWAYSLWPTKLEPHVQCIYDSLHRLETDDRETREITVDGKSDRIPITPIVIKHYVYRSWEEYMRSRGATKKTSNSDKNPWYNNIDKWLKGNFTTFELVPDFTRQMAQNVRSVLQTRELPAVPHLPTLK